MFVLFLLQPSSTNPDPAKLRSFETWQREKNIYFPKVQIATDGRFAQGKPGMIATDSIAEGEIILRVPIQQVISARYVEVSQVNELVFRIHMQYGEGKSYNPAFYESLAILLLHEKYFNPNSELQLWLDVLPQVEDMNNILFFKYPELSELEGSPLYQRALDRRKEVKEHYQWFVNNIFRPYPRIFPTEPTEEQFKWAVSIVRSRNIQIIDAQEEPALVPIMGMFRNTPLIKDTVNWAWDADKEELIVYSLQNYSVGDEVFISFSEKCNSELADFHGFVFDDNPNDCVHADLEIFREDPLWEVKSTMYEASNFDPAKLKFVRSGVTRELLRAVRTISLPADDLQPEMMTDGVSDFSLGLVSDLAIADYMQALCRRMYLGYPTSLEEDEELLKTQDLPYRKRMCVLNRVGEKKILMELGHYYFSRTGQLAQEVRNTAQLDEKRTKNDVHNEL